jgi:hypothetical protein
MNNLPAIKRNIFKLILDITIFLVLLLSLDRRLTGKPLHEWLPIAGTAAIILHILMSWKWITGVTHRLFARGSLKQKISYILNWLLFIDFVLAMWSGIRVSRLALPSLGIHLAAASSGWHWLHSQSADLLLFILALHLALNWGWVANLVKSHILQPLFSPAQKRKTGLTTAEKG